MKKLITIPFLSLLVALSFVSCLDLGSGGNREEGTLLAVVGYEPKESVLTMRTRAGIFSAPGLSTLTSDLMPGDCILAQFTIDWDHQPKKDSLTRATNIQYTLVEQSLVQVNDFDETAPLDFDVEDLLPIQSLSFQDYTPYFNGKAFIVFGHVMPAKQEMEYTMTLRPSDLTDDYTITAYVIGKKLSRPTGSATNVNILYAIDMYHAIFDLGKESTVKENALEYTSRELKVKFKYCTGVDENNVPLYQDSDKGTVVLSVFAD
jgi:hypothetical protein